ncbi:MAG: helix-turn-helix transcriptional regulator [Opitutaceae bacterium]|nr:helix-turn-helix transcriptional regulator [Opitutaceae bacterium]
MPHLIDPTIKTRLLLRPLVSPLGTLRLGGVNQGGFGVGMLPDRPRTLACYGMVHITRGRGSYEDRTTPKTAVEPGDTILFFPGRPHRAGTQPGEFWDELWFEFEGPIFDLMRKSGLLNPNRPLQRGGDPEQGFRRFFQILPPVHLRKAVKPEVIVCRFATALTELLVDSRSPLPTETTPDDWVGAACELLSVRESGPSLTPADVARRLGFSYETFRKRFRTAIGCSPGRFQLDSRIDRAAALLHQGRTSIKEISAQLAFCDEFYFSRCFKRRFGSAPQHFRRRVRGG